jgi:2Fe-2S ferredoxin
MRRGFDAERLTMVAIEVIAREGSQRRIEAADSLNLMEALRDNGFGELLALCGGCCSCATCHVYVEEGTAELQQAGSEDENDLLDSSDHRRANSRLSRQVMLGAECEGVVVRFEPAD